MINLKTREELEKINTKNLLALYKAERKRNFSFVGSHTCQCCGEVSENKEFKKEQKVRADYLDLIKTSLDKREHVEQKAKTEKNGNTNKATKRRAKKA